MYVTAVHAGHPASKCDIRKNDIITEVDGVRVKRWVVAYYAGVVCEKKVTVLEKSRPLWGLHG